MIINQSKTIQCISDLINMLQIKPTSIHFEVSFQYHKDIVADIKTIKGAQWNPVRKLWTVPVQKKELLELLGRKWGCSYDLSQNKQSDLPDLPELKQHLPLKIKPFAYQEKGIAAGMMWQRFINGDDPGLGKAQPLTAKIATPFGWQLMKDIKIGDAILGVDGSSYHVTGVFPQGKRPCYKISFNDGTSTECDIDHIWSVRDQNRRRRNKGWINKTTGELKAADLFHKPSQKRIDNGRASALKWEIPLCTAFNKKDTDFVIPPYILGALLGDGSLTQKMVVISIPEQKKDIKERIAKLLPYNLKLRVNNKPSCPQYYITQTKSTYPNPYHKYIINSGLNKLSKNKFIPYEYLFASKQQRLDLLRGLMDTDGSAKNNRIVFHSCCKKLAEDVQQLVLSLGGISNIRTYDRIIENKSIEYQVNININECPFYITYKANHWRESRLSKYIQSIEYIGEKEQQCISVSAPDHLYLTDNFIATHNTLEAIATTIGAQCKCTLVICPATLKQNWQNEFYAVAGIRAMVLTPDIKNTWHKYYTAGMCNVFICNFESLKTYFVESISKNAKDHYDSKHVMFKESIQIFDNIIIDEAHRLKSMKTLAYILAKGICYGKRYVQCLTGTPIVNSAKDILPLLILTHRLNLFGGFTFFLKNYCDGSNEGLRSLQRQLYNTCFFRRLKKDVLTDLPDKTYQVIQCDISNRTEYDAALRDLSSYLKRWKERTTAEVVQSLEAETLVKIQVCRNIAARGKIEMAIEQIDEVIDSGQKIVVFIHQKEIALTLMRKYPHAVTVRGDDSEAARSSAVASFQTRDSCNIIICSIKAAGVGITLTAAYNALMVEWPWHPSDCDQCIDRLHRIGQKNAVLAKFLLAKNTIDEMMYRIIENKRNISNTVTASKESFKKEVLDLLSNSLFKNTVQTI